MAIDVLQDKIRKLKNPSILDLAMTQDMIPPQFTGEDGFLCACERYIRALLEQMRGVVPAVRFSFDDYALEGPQGLALLSALLKEARAQGYYVLLDAPSIHTPWGAERAADRIFGGSEYPCDALAVSAYIGSDAIRPFVYWCKKDKDIFVVLRSPNRSASDLQDLLTGARLVHSAAADVVNRFAEPLPSKCGYSRIGISLSATSASSLKNMRSAYKSLFFLVDGLDYPSGNHKNCMHAFDRLGHGAIVSAGPSVTAAWKQSQDEDALECAVQAADRMKKNLCRYISVL